MFNFEFIGQGLVTTIIGISIVFIILIVLAFALSMLKLVNKSEKKNEISVIENIVQQEIPIEKNLVDDLELVAVITSVLASQLNTSTDKLIVRSIRKSSNWIKNQKVSTIK